MHIRTRAQKGISRLRASMIIPERLRPFLRWSWDSRTIALGSRNSETKRSSTKASASPIGTDLRVNSSSERHSAFKKDRAWTSRGRCTIRNQSSDEEQDLTRSYLRQRVRCSHQNDGNIPRSGLRFQWEAMDKLKSATPIGHPSSQV